MSRILCVLTLALSGCVSGPVPGTPDSMTPDAGRPGRDASAAMDAPEGVDAAVPVRETDAGAPADASSPGPSDIVDETPEEAVAREAEEASRTAALVSRPDVNDWRRRVIYFVLVDRFRNGAPAYDRLHGDAVCNDPGNAHAYQGGDLVGLRRHLDYIEELGADSIWITPLYRGVESIAGMNCGFPGYWADFADPYELELDPRFGRPADFDGLIDEMHRRDMPLMLDMVVNHAGYNARLLRQHPAWFTDPSTCTSQGPADIFCSLAGLPDFDHRIPAVRDYLVDVHRQWLQRFDVDAIRMDTVKHVEPSYFATWTSAMREERPGMYMIGELLDEGSFHQFDRYLDAGFDGLFNFPL